MSPRLKIYGQLVLWVVGFSVACALIWNGLGWWMDSVEPEAKRSLALGFTHPLAYVAYALPGLTFGTLMWAASTSKERMKLEPLNLPKSLAILDRLRFPLVIAGSAALGYALDRSWGGVIGGGLLALFIYGMCWAGATIHKDDRKTYQRRQTRRDLARRIDVAIDGYIKMLPPLKSRARDKEFPFLSRIHHVNSLALDESNGWGPPYFNYAAGTFRTLEVTMKELKLDLFREDIIWAILHAATATLENGDGKFDVDAAEEAVAKMEALIVTK